MQLYDRNRPTTVEDLIRRYSLDKVGKTVQLATTTSQGLTKTQNLLANYISQTTTDLDKIKTQLDGSITTYYSSGVPTKENKPASEWTDYSEHIGDLYYDKDTGRAYIWEYTTDYGWNNITDNQITEALAKAEKAQDTADGKRRTFYEVPSTPYDLGDIWIYNNEIYRCQVARQEGDFHTTDWINDLKYTDDTYARGTQQALDAFILNVQQTYATTASLTTETDKITARVDKVQLSVDGKSQVFQQEPTTPYNKGDLWVVEDKVYSCINTRKEGLFNQSDWEINVNLANYVTSARLQVELDKIEAEIGDVTEVTTFEESETAQVDLVGITPSEPIKLTVYPIGKSISYLYPGANTFPGTACPTIRTVRFLNVSTNEHFDYELPIDLLYYDEDNYDTFDLDFESYICKVIKKCKRNSDGTISTQEEETLNYEYPLINLTAGDYRVSVLGYSEAYIATRLMKVNLYSGQYVTRAQMNNKITQTKEETLSEVSINYATLKGLGDLETSFNTKIKQTATKISLTANAGTKSAGLTIKLLNDDGTQLDSGEANISFTGLVSFEDLSQSGKTTINGANIQTGTIDATKIKANSITADKLNVGGTLITSSNISTVSLNASQITAGTINVNRIPTLTADKINVGGTIITNNTIGTYELNASKITSGTLSADRIASESITSSKIASGAITADKISVGGTIITSANISSQTISANQISGGSISGSLIKGGTISGQKISGGTISGSKITVTSGTIGKWSISSKGITSGTWTLEPDGISNSTTCYSWSSIIKKLFG